MLDTHSAAARRRPDAERNREKILATAREAFAEGGTEVSMAEVARRAGVGMATLYRNFAGRRELLDALYAEEVTAICDAATTIGGEGVGDDARARLNTWLRQLFLFFASKRHIAAELLKQTDSDDPVFTGNRDRVLAAGRPLLEAAQRDGSVRGELDLAQILDLVHAVATIDGDAAHVQPILQAALDGMRARG